MLRRSMFRIALCALGGLGAAFFWGCAAEVEGAEDAVAETAAALACAPEVPAVIAVPEGNKLAFALDATGVQTYQCQANAAGGFAWTFIAPDADLFKRQGRRPKLAGTHYAGPTWEALDGSTVVAARVAGHTQDPSAIPWLLLQATSHTGKGKMSDVTYIHRLDTVGGIAPAATSCDADHVGANADVDYTATYYFYAAEKKKKK